MQGVNFGKTAADYGRYRAGFPDRFFDHLFFAKYVEQGEQVLDLGTGTGTIARGLALRGCRVVGLDIAEQLPGEARRQDRASGVQVEYKVASAEKTGQESGCYDLVIAGQCWHWFDSAAAAIEASRILKPGGRLAIAYLDWLPLNDGENRPNVVAATETLIRKHNPLWDMHGGDGFHSGYLLDLTRVGFGEIESFSFDWQVPYSHEAWRGRIRASAGVSATLSPEQVQDFDRELAEILKRDFPEQGGAPLGIPHRIWCAVARKPH
jgi:SAM-dependent methyltransferase